MVYAGVSSATSVLDPITMAGENETERGRRGGGAGRVKPTLANCVLCQRAIDQRTHGKHAKLLARVRV